MKQTDCCCALGKPPMPLTCTNTPRTTASDPGPGGLHIRTVFNHPEVYAVELKESRRAVGCVGILIGANSNFEISEQEGEIAYWIGVPYWGQGLIPEAVREVMRHAFETLKLKALWCGYFAENTQSHAAQSKCGFRYHHTEEHKYNAFLQDYRTEHISCITYSQWLECGKQSMGRG